MPQGEMERLVLLWSVPVNLYLLLFTEVSAEKS